MRAHRSFNQQSTISNQQFTRRPLTASPGSAIDTHVLIGDKADDIAAFAAGRGADVLIDGAGDVRSMAEVGTAYRLLCMARCPVLVLPRREAGSHSAKPRPRLHDAA